MAAETLTLRGVLKGHSGWVTALATTAENRDFLLSGSRDKTLLVWNLTREDVSNYGVPVKSLTGHSHFVSDVVISSDGQFALSASWDCTLRLWDLNFGTSTRRFVGHTKDILSVAFSVDNRQIVSSSRDGSLKLWNTLGECKYTIDGEGGHTEWASCVRFSPNPNIPVIVSGGWDKMVKVWNLAPSCKLKNNFAGHTGVINAVAVSPDGTLCASGGKDGTARLWDLSKNEAREVCQAGSTINTLCFSPNRYWLCAGTDNGIKIWDVESNKLVVELTKNDADFQLNGKTAACTSLAWSADGTLLFAGYSDNNIRVWEVVRFN